MTRAYIFSDESGCFTFDEGGSRYFMVCTIMLPDCNIGTGLLDLRRELIMQGFEVKEEFHAAQDKPEVRKEVFQYISRHKFRIDATLLEKRKMPPGIHRQDVMFYKTAWFHHFNYVGPILLRNKTEALITTASIGTKRKKAAFKNAVTEVVEQAVNQQSKSNDFRCEFFFPKSISDPCLQITDYYAWAIQRRWARGERGYYEFIQDKISTEYDLWGRINKTYY